MGRSAIHHGCSPARSDIALDEAGKFGERRDHDLALTQADHCGGAIVGERPFDEVHHAGGRSRVAAMRSKGTGASGGIACGLVNRLIWRERTT